ncbi:MAG: hypothetical protein JZU55_10925, partial [Afipia sp.]|nr:hypothetical protein [Afipia sp.]
ADGITRASLRAFLHDPDRSCVEQRADHRKVRAACPAAIRRLGEDGQRPVARADIFEIARTIGRMDAIRNIKTMAGSPDADANALQSASRNLAHGFCVSWVRAFVNP